MESTQLGYYSNPDKIWNSAYINPYGKLYRERVECLILKKNKVFLYFKSNGKYKIPGGSSEKGISLEKQLSNECKEESRIVIDKPKFIMTYTTEQSRIKYGVKYDGRLNHLYVAQYNGRYNGIILECDRDDDMTEYGKFYKIKKVFFKLTPEHQTALLPDLSKSTRNKIIKQYSNS